MKLVQAKIPEIEYIMLKKKAAREHRTLQDVIRESLRASILSDEVDPTDAFFQEFSAAETKGKKENTSVRHDDVLYGGHR
jgi:plasmid stability protein